MSFLDKVKETTQHVAADLKKGAAQVQTKVGQVQLRRKADEHAKDIGYLVVRERTEGTSAGAEIDRLVAAIVEVERQIAEAKAQEAAAGEGSTGPAADEGGTGQAAE